MINLTHLLIEYRLQEVITMELRPIKTESDYQNALQEIESLFDAEPNSPQCDRLDILTTLVEAYERQHYPIDVPDAISV